MQKELSWKIASVYRTLSSAKNETLEEIHLFRQAEFTFLGAGSSNLYTAEIFLVADFIDKRAG